MKEFMQLQPQQWQEIYTYYSQLVSYSQDPAEILKLISLRLQGFGFSNQISSQIATHLIKHFQDRDFKELYDDPQQDSIDDPQIYLSTQDLEYIETHILTSPHITPELLRLIITYAAFARLNPHRSNWIKCDKKDKTTVLYLSSNSNLPVSKQEALIQDAHAYFGLNMRVVGSTQPIPCFQFPWQASQPPVNETDANLLHTIGPLAPKTITDFAKSLLIHRDISTEE